MINKLHYFDDDKPAPNDIQLAMAKKQGYVPVGCLLAGVVVMSLVTGGNDPCKGCNCNRSKCGGRPE